jgi:hypothetical protein
MGRRLGEAKRARREARLEKVKLEDRVAFLVKERQRTNKQLEEAQ